MQVTFVLFLVAYKLLNMHPEIANLAMPMIFEILKKENVWKMCPLKRAPKIATKSAETGEVIAHQVIRWDREYFITVSS